jgi:hypothetical protein
MAASAGYWLASQCTEIIATPSGDVGSVGVYMCHTDYSTMNDRIGIKPTYVGVPKYRPRAIRTRHCLTRRGGFCSHESRQCTTRLWPTSCADVDAG